MSDSNSSKLAGHGKKIGTAKAAPNMPEPGFFKLAFPNSEMAYMQNLETGTWSVPAMPKLDEPGRMIRRIKYEGEYIPTAEENRFKMQNGPDAVYVAKDLTHPTTPEPGYVGCKNDSPDRAERNAIFWEKRRKEDMKKTK